jgi:hypothetical protein
VSACSAPRMTTPPLSPQNPLIFCQFLLSQLPAALSFISNHQHQLLAIN